MDSILRNRPSETEWERGRRIGPLHGRAPDPPAVAVGRGRGRGRFAVTTASGNQIVVRWTRTRLLLLPSTTLRDRRRDHFRS